MIQLQNVSLAYAGQQVLDRLNWSITPGARIGLIGPNGAGKTTLLRLIAGEEEPDEGTIHRGNLTVGYLKQDIQESESDDPDRTVREAALEAFEEVLALEEREENITQALEEADDYTTDRYERLLNQLGRVQSRLTAREAHTIRPRTDATLTGLGFAPEELDRPLRSFSGGWQMRVALARLLLQRPDVLLLDEPTNHLDIDSIDWLEEYLKGFEGTVVIVSHDRFFLDRMVTSIAELAHGHVTPYDGNYSYYLEAREERRKLQQARYENQQRKIAEIQAFIDKFRYNASKAAQVQSRIKQLEKMERVPPPPPETSSMTLRFPEPSRSGRTVLELSSFSKAYASDEGLIRVFDDAGPLEIERGDKIALIGPNGAGKSTLLRILLGREPFEGERELGHKVEPAFFAQHQADVLDYGQTVLESLRERAPRKDDTELRTFLGAFLFEGDDVFKKVGVLSGGEKSRLALARTLIKPANFLLLDEPTNHLDLPSKEVLIDALQQYSGTFVLVSHDRHFLGEVADQIWRVERGDVLTFPGTYEEYRWHREHGSGAWRGDGAPADAEDGKAPTAKTDSSRSGPKTKEEKRREAEARNRRYRKQQDEGDAFASLNPYQLRQKLEETEAAILEKEEKQEELEAALADPGLYDEPGRAQETSKAYDAVKRELAELYETWEVLAERVAGLEGA